MKKTVAFLGLGTMGGAMSKNLLKAGFAVRGYDPSPAAAEAARKNGVEILASAAEAVTGVEVICSVVPGPDDVRALYLGEKGVLAAAAKGAVCFDFSTITPEASCQVAEAAAKIGVIFLDTPVSGTAPKAISAELTLMAGGDKAALEKHKDVL
ncbi:MAG: NAD(P)-binding domain-containing protein, partial [Nitrospinota bacterium]